MKALINKIIPYSFIDGPGSRMVLFTQGCNMHCLYCHNPETQNRCLNCGACLAVCPGGALSFKGNKLVYNAAFCRNCDCCLAACPNFSSPKCRATSVEEILRQIDAARDFLDGITVSGGEATLQAEFVAELFHTIKNADSKGFRLTTFLDTNGFMPQETCAKLLPVTDGFMVDLKAYDPGRHLELTAVDNAVILENIIHLGATNRLYEIRTVVVPGFTDNETEIRNIAAFIKNLNNYTRWKLIPFRPLGVKTFLRNASPPDEGTFYTLLQIAREILGERATAVL